MSSTRLSPTAHLVTLVLHQVQSAPPSSWRRLRQPGRKLIFGKGTQHPWKGFYLVSNMNKMRSKQDAVRYVWTIRTYFCLLLWILDCFYRITRREGNNKQVGGQTLYQAHIILTLRSCPSSSCATMSADSAGARATIWGIASSRTCLQRAWPSHLYMSHRRFLNTLFFNIQIRNIFQLTLSTIIFMTIEWNDGLLRQS